MKIQASSRLGALLILSLCLAGGTASADGPDYSWAGGQQAGVSCGSANASQISGNISSIWQSGSNSSASVEQQYILGGYANAASILQDGSHNTASISQSGSRNAAGIAQSGANLTASVGQSGTNLGVQVNQYGNNAAIGVTQFGTGPAGAPPITITTFK